MMLGGSQYQAKDTDAFGATLRTILEKAKKVYVAVCWVFSRPSCTPLANTTQLAHALGGSGGDRF